MAVGAEHPGQAGSPEARRSAPGARGVAGALVPQQEHAHVLVNASWSVAPLEQQVDAGLLSTDTRFPEPQQRCSAASAPAASQAQNLPDIGWANKTAANSQEVSFGKPATQCMRISLLSYCTPLHTSLRSIIGCGKTFRPPFLAIGAFATC